jgi:hypothetical protein
VTLLEFDIWEWTRAGLHHDAEALAWMGSFAPPNTVVGPVQLVAEGRLAVHTMPLPSPGEVLSRRVVRHVVGANPKVYGWVTTRRVHDSDRPIPPQVAAIFHPPTPWCPCPVADERST